MPEGNYFFPFTINQYHTFKTSLVLYLRVVSEMQINSESDASIQTSWTQSAFNDKLFELIRKESASKYNNLSWTGV